MTKFYVRGFFHLALAAAIVTYIGWFGFTHPYYLIPTSPILFLSIVALLLDIYMLLRKKAHSAIFWGSLILEPLLAICWGVILYKGHLGIDWGTPMWAVLILPMVSLSAIASAIVAWRELGVNRTAEGISGWLSSRTVQITIAIVVSLSAPIIFFLLYSWFYDLFGF